MIKKYVHVQARKVGQRFNVLNADHEVVYSGTETQFQELHRSFRDIGEEFQGIFDKLLWQNYARNFILNGRHYNGLRENGRECSLDLRYFVLNRIQFTTRTNSPQSRISSITINARVFLTNIINRK